MPDTVRRLLVFVLPLVLNILSYDITVVLVFLAAVLGILNYRHTRKALRIASYPVLQIELGISEERLASLYWPVSHLSCRLTNTSNSVSISHIGVSILVAKRRQGIRVWQRRWLRFCDLPVVPFLPPVETACETSKDACPEGFEHFLAECIGPVLERRTVPLPGHAKELGYYRVVHPVPLVLAVRVRYQASLPDARPKQVNRQYRVVPDHGCLERGSLRDIDCLTGWRLPE